MKYNYFEPGKMFYLNGLGCGETSVAIRNNALKVKNNNPLIAIAITSQIQKIIGDVSLTLDVLKAAIESVSDKEMRLRMSRGTIQDFKAHLGKR